MLGHKNINSRYLKGHSLQIGKITFTALIAKFVLEYYPGLDQNILQVL